MSQKRRTDKSSTTAAVQGFAGVMSDVPLPDGIELRSDLERTIWHQFSRARAREDWRDMHHLALVILSLPVVVFLYFGLDFLLSEPNPSMFEDIDQWCEQYRPELTYSQCMDEAGL